MNISKQEQDASVTRSIRLNDSRGTLVFYEAFDRKGLWAAMHDNNHEHLNHIRLSRKQVKLLAKLLNTLNT